MKISTFILENMDGILAEWDAFAASFGAVTETMSAHDLRDHAKEILQFVVADIETDETADQAEKKSRGKMSSPEADDSASSTHGKLRYLSGFTLSQLISEYRALRASVLKLWQQNPAAVSVDSIQDIMRFNEAIDQSLSDAAVAYSTKLNETRDIFLAILGHDLRGPLAATATAGTYLLRPGAFDHQVQQIGLRVKRSATTMNSMVNDLLELARVQLGDGIPIERRECDLLEMCQWAIVDATAVHPRAQFELNATGELTGMFDQSRLQQLLTNLANNAAQYGATGEPIVIEIAGEPDRILLEVRNHGPVIPGDAMHSMFSSLVQLPADADHPRARSSLGLGLFIAKQIAVAHGGDVTVTSDERNGTVFTVTVPRQ